MKSHYWMIFPIGHLFLLLVPGEWRSLIVFVCATIVVVIFVFVFLLPYKAKYITRSELVAACTKSFNTKNKVTVKQSTSNT